MSSERVLSLKWTKANQGQLAGDSHAGVERTTWVGVTSQTRESQTLIFFLNLITFGSRLDEGLHSNKYSCNVFVSFPTSKVPEEFGSAVGI